MCKTQTDSFFRFYIKNVNQLVCDFYNFFRRGHFQRKTLCFFMCKSRSLGYCIIWLLVLRNISLLIRHFFK